jgi:TDG/mug DNA glycosylase family protein
MTYHHLPRERLPMALADLHGALAVGAPLDLQVVHGAHDGPDLPGDDIGGRWFSTWTPDDLAHVVTGAGFDVEAVDVLDAGTRNAVTRLQGTRAHTLADTVGPGMRLLVCGLNPSVYSADRGVGYARPGNRFWKAVVAAGLVAPERALRPRDVLVHDRIGITDLCKRATVASAELRRDEYVDGAARVAWVVEQLQPGAVCFVGLEGWRAAIDRKAVAGPQSQPFGGRPAYVLPSTSGLNAHSRLDDLVDHFRAAARLADDAR